MRPLLLLLAASAAASLNLDLNDFSLAPRADDILRIADHFLPHVKKEKKREDTSIDADKTSAAESESATGTAFASDSTITDAPKTDTTGTTDKTDTDTKEDTTNTDKTDTDTDTKSKKKATSTSVSINPAAGPGGVSMLTPAVTASETFVKVGTNVTFAWNYTSLTITPSGIDVLAWNSQASRAYTLTHNASVHETQTVIWDTKDYMQTAESDPIVNGKYTLMIYDSKHGPSDVASAGHLGAYTQFTFGVYTPQSYTPWSSWKCDSCNGALSDVERQSLKFLFAMAGVTVLSFGWFVNGLGLL